MGVEDGFLNYFGFMDSMNVYRREILIDGKQEAHCQQHPQGNYGFFVGIDFVNFQFLFFLLFLVILFSNLNHIGSSFLIV